MNCDGLMYESVLYVCDRVFFLTRWRECESYNMSFSF